MVITKIVFEASEKRNFEKVIKAAWILGEMGVLGRNV
jgi:hypothetical protein